jgi:hypothetical protein
VDEDIRVAYAGCKEVHVGNDKAGGVDHLECAQWIFDEIEAVLLVRSK